MAMKSTRESLNKRAEEIKRTLSLDASATNVDAFKAYIQNQFDAFVEFAKEHAEDEDMISAAKAPVTRALNLYHDEMRMQRLEQLSTMPSKEADAEYLRTQCVLGMKLKSDKDGVWSIVTSTKNKDGAEVPVTVGLSAYDYIAYCRPVEMNGLKDACVIFAENVCKNEFGASAGISRKALHSEYIALRERMGWTLPKDGKASNTALARQLTEIFHFMMRDVELTMENPDVKFVRSTIINGVDKPDQAGAYMLRNEETIINTVFRAGYTRINKLPYGFQNQTNAENHPLSVAKEPVHEEVESKKKDKPVVDAETVEASKAE